MVAVLSRQSAKSASAAGDLPATLAVALEALSRLNTLRSHGTLNLILIRKPKTKPLTPQNMCADKGYDFPEVRELLEDWGYTIHLPSRGEARPRKRIPGYRARHWVVERTHSWMNRFRRLLIRWEKKVENYLAMLHLACAYITYHAARLFG
jgi:putative transposase